jgi:hypothetical protein
MAAFASVFAFGTVTKQMRVICLSLVFACGVVACSSAEVAPGGTADAAPIDGGNDAAAPSDAADAAVACDVAPEPTSLPGITSEFVFVEGDGGVPVPEPEAGDPKGTWIASKLTVHLKESARSAVDPTASKVTGTGWATFTDTEYRIHFNTVSEIATTIAGTIIRGSETAAKGSYTLSGGSLVVTPVCSTGQAQGGSFGFVRVGPDKIRLVLKPASGGGALADAVAGLVFDADLRP